MKVVFMGTPEFATRSLSELLKHHDVLAVVCQPDKPNKRGNKIVFGAVKQFALKNGIEVLQPESIKQPEFIEKIAGYMPDVIVVAAYGKLLPDEILKLPPYGCINVHASMLPKYRGAAPVQWAIINGEEQTGVTIMYMNAGLDTGDMIEKRHVPIDVSDTYGDLLEKLAVVGADALISSLDGLANGTAKAIIQNDAEATYAPIIKKETGHINWRDTGKNIVNLVRGLNPAPGAYSEFEGQILKVWKAEVFGKADNSSDFGMVIDVLPKRGIVVNATRESVILTELQFSGSKKMNAADLLRGHKIEKGMLMN